MGIYISMNPNINDFKHSKKYTQHSKNYQLKLPLELDIFIPENATVRLLSQLLEELDYTSLYQAYSTQGRKFKISPVILFKVIVFGYLENHYSSRAIAKACTRDTHFMWLLQGHEPPSHQLINSFRKNRLSEESLEDLFYQFIGFLIESKEIEVAHLFIDGTKIEANANRYSFVWEKSISKYEAKLHEKVPTLFTQLDKQLGFSCLFSEEDVLGSLELALHLLSKERERTQQVFVYGKGKRKTPFQRLYEKTESYLNRQRQYTKSHQLFKGRSSYSKTDKDATFMRLKEDHMKNGQLKPAYNVQVAVESEYIVSVQHFSQATDTNTLIPFLDHLAEKLGLRYPNIIADAGYESEENYTYLEANQQVAYIKPLNYEQAKTKKYKQNIGKRENMTYQPEGDFYLCANHQKLVNIGTKIKKTKKTKFESTVTMYQCHDCEGCPLRDKCTTAKNGKMIQVSKEFIRLREQSQQNITTPKGISLRMNRSIQAEGTFGVLKQDHYFRRFLTRGNKQVLTELLLVALSFNIRKLHTKIQENRTETHLFKSEVA